MPAATRAHKSAQELLGVPEVPKTGRGRLVATAVELFYRHGFARSDRPHPLAGVTKTTFYKHFDGGRADGRGGAPDSGIRAGPAVRKSPATTRPAAPGHDRRHGHLVQRPGLWRVHVPQRRLEFPNPLDPVHQPPRRTRKCRDQRAFCAAGASESAAEIFADCYGPPRGCLRS
jgi:hypothetical protein